MMKGFQEQIIDLTGWFSPVGDRGQKATSWALQTLFSTPNLSPWMVDHKLQFAT